MIPEILKTLVLALAVAYSAFAATAFLLQDRLLYLPDLPSRNVDATPADLGLPFEPLTLETADGEKLDAWFVPAPNARGTLLYLHGNAGNIAHRLEPIRMFHRIGLSVLIFDYRGYGRSSGRPSEEGTYRDGEAAWRHLVEQRRILPGNIVLFGESLGAAVAAKLAADREAAALVIVAGFTSVPDLAATLYPWLPARQLARFRYDTRAYLARAHSPALIFHSREDEITPYSHGEALYAAAHPPKAFVPLTGGHNDAYTLNLELIGRETDRFLSANRSR